MNDVYPRGRSPLIRFLKRIVSGGFAGMRGAMSPNQIDEEVGESIDVFHDHDLADDVIAFLSFWSLIIIRCDDPVGLLADLHER